MRVLLVALSLFIFQTMVAAQATTTDQPINQTSIEGALKADGTLKPNTAGSFSANGFEMKLAADGTPSFVPKTGGGAETNIAPTAGCDDNWDDQFNADGANSTVRVIAADGAGNIYIGGEFSVIGNVTANRIAKWNGTAWSALGTGMNNTVQALAVSGTDVYAGGAFTTAGGVTANRIARWNGAAWSALGTGMNNNVNALAVSGTDLYAGGSFSTAGCRPSNNFARYFLNSFTGASSTDWNTGANWSSGTVPAANSDVTISTADVSISADTSIRNLRVDAGRTITINGGATLTVSGILNVEDGFIDGAGKIVVTSCASTAVIGGSSTGMIRTTLRRCVGAGGGTFVFPVGTLAGYGPVELSSITGSGTVEVTPKAGVYPTNPTGLPSPRLKRWWVIENPAGGIVQTDLTFGYQDADINGAESLYSAFRISGGTAQQQPGTINTTTNRQKATAVTQFSDWTLAQATPLAASVKVGGRVTGIDGVGVGKTRVTLVEQNGAIRTALTNPFGYYLFEDVSVGQTITVNAAHKQFTFAPQIVSVSEDVGNLGFTAVP